MKSALAVALVASLATPSVSVAAQETAWSEIRWSKPGREMTVRTPGSEPSRRAFIRADDDGIILLNVSNPDVPSDVMKLLRRKAADHPEYFPLPADRTIALDTNASLNASGVFVAGRKIANYDQVVERIGRADVEGGAVSLEVKAGWSTSKQIFVVLGVVVAVAASIVIIPCMANGCP